MARSALERRRVLLVVLAPAIALLGPVSGLYPNGFATRKQRQRASQAARLASKVDRDSIQAEAVWDLQTYLRFNTTNPPGNERATAAWLAGRLRSKGISVALEQTAPVRTNVVAQLPGNGNGRPILLASHIHVVPADPNAWDHPPFRGDQVGIEGRG